MKKKKPFVHSPLQPGDGRRLLAQRGGRAFIAKLIANGTYKAHMERMAELRKIAHANRSRYAKERRTRWWMETNAATCGHKNCECICHVLSAEGQLKFNGRTET